MVFVWKLPIAAHQDRASTHTQKIFDRFYRIVDAGSRDAGGAGLGLSIAQWAVRIHGGDIAVVSAAQVGSTFQIHLPQTDV